MCEFKENLSELEYSYPISVLNQFKSGNNTWQLPEH